MPWNVLGGAIVIRRPVRGATVSPGTNWFPDWFGSAGGQERSWLGKRAFDRFQFSRQAVAGRKILIARLRL